MHNTLREAQKYARYEKPEKFVLYSYFNTYQTYDKQSYSEELQKATMGGK